MMYVNEETGRGEAWSECGIAEVRPRTWANAYPNAWAEIYKCSYCRIPRQMWLC